MDRSEGLRSTFGTAYQDYRTTGFELQGRLQPRRGLSLTGGLGYTHTRLGPNGASIRTVAGNGVPNTPEWTATSGFEYETSGDTLRLPGVLSIGAQYQFTGDRPADVSHPFDLEAYHIVNLRVAWKDGSGKLEIYAFGRNVLDQRAETAGSLFLGARTVAVGQGRIAGLGITKRL